MKAWVSKGEEYPVYYLAVEGDDDAGMGWPIELTEDELADLNRVWGEFFRVQGMLEKRARGL